MNLAYVSPLPPMRSGVADYSASLLSHLRPYFEKILAVVEGYVPDLAAGLVDEVVDVSQCGDRWFGPGVIPLYHVGCNTRYHGYVYRALRHMPGLTVLHDGNLLPFIHEMTAARGDRAGFLREAAFEGGPRGVSDGWAALFAGRTLAPERYPMISRVARSSLGVIVHSRYLRDRVLEAHRGARVEVVPMLDPSPPSGRLSRRKAKESLGYPDDVPLIGAFGFIAASKQLDIAVQAFARLRHEFPDARFACVGELVPGYRFEELVRGVGLQDSVRITGYLPPDVFSRYVAAVDVGVNLRNPTWGEGSATLVRLMGHGVPSVVTDTGAFAELPGEAVVTVTGGAGNVGAVEAALRDLLRDRELRARIGAAARRYVEDYCSPPLVALRYVEFIRSLVHDGCQLIQAGAPA